MVDPEGNRTIGVLTKLDLMDEGTDALEILKNELFPLKHGFVGVVNRSQKEIDTRKDIGSALSKEQEWFANHHAYKTIAKQCGTGFLREKLRLVRNRGDGYPFTSNEDLDFAYSEDDALVEAPLAHADGGGQGRFGDAQLPLRLDRSVLLG